MSRRCPECGHATPRNVAPGRAYACHKCGNPVLATEHAAPRSTAVAPEPAPSPEAPSIDRPSAPRAPWKLALLAFVVLGAAYVGAYELLTAEAQRDRAKLLAIHGEKVATYPEPAPPVSGDPKPLRDYLVAQSLYQDRQRFHACESRIAAGRIGMAVAFGAQTLFAIWAMTRAWRARARAAAATVRAERV